MLQASLRTKMERAPLSADRSILFQSSRTTTCQAGGAHNKSVGAAQCPTFTQILFAFDSKRTRSTIVHMARPNDSVWMEPPPFLPSASAASAEMKKTKKQNCADRIQTHIYCIFLQQLRLSVYDIL